MLGQASCWPNIYLQNFISLSRHPTMSGLFLSTKKPGRFEDPAPQRFVHSLQAFHFDAFHSQYSRISPWTVRL